jgi:hypothetical protein
MGEEGRDPLHCECAGIYFYRSNMSRQFSFYGCGLFSRMPITLLCDRPSSVYRGSSCSSSIPRRIRTPVPLLFSTLLDPLKHYSRQMAELISLTDLPSISSSINHICTSSSAPLALTAAGIHAVLRRTKSMGYRDDIKENRKSIITYGKGQVDNEDENARGRPNSLVRANSRRRRSAASVHQMEIGGRSRRSVTGLQHSYFLLTML